MGRVFPPRLLQELLLRTLPRRRSRALPHADLVSVDSATLRAAFRPLLRRHTWLLGSDRIVAGRDQTACTNGLQKARAHLGPTNQEERPNGIERRLSVLTRNERIRDVQRQRDHAREDQQPPGRAQHVHRGTSEREVPRPQQEAEDRKIDRGRDKRRNPDRHAQTKGEVENIAEAEQERQSNYRAHDHSDGSNDDRVLGRRLRQRRVVVSAHQASPGLSTWKLPSMTSIPLENRWSGAGPSARSPAGGTSWLVRTPISDQGPDQPMLSTAA